LAQHKYNPHLDGLRGIAILMVICFHYFGNFGIFNFGWAGVDLFFVLSGYLLTGRLFPYLNDKKLLGKFYLNRFLRIVPIYYAFLFTFYFLTYFLGSLKTIQNTEFYRSHFLGFFAFLSNWIFIFSNSSSHEYFNHLWSLAVEEQYYILFPLFVIVVSNKKRLLQIGIFLFLLIPIIRSLYFFNYNPEYNKIYWNTFFRADSFLLGFVMYMAIQNGLKHILKKHVYKIAIATFLIIIIGTIIEGTMKANTFFCTLGFTVLSIFFSCLVFLVEEDNYNLLKSLTLNRLLRYTGKISFGLYLFNWPVFIVGYAILNTVSKKLNLNLSINSIHLLNAFQSLVFSFILSSVSFHYYESFFLKWKTKPNI
jgi:peptidoglycan/LPS O-acetylase OafA/YrhL